MMVNNKKNETKNEASKGSKNSINDEESASSSFSVPNFAASAVSRFNGKDCDDFSFGFRHAMQLYSIDDVLEVTDENDPKFDKKKNSLAIMLFMKNVEPRYINFVKMHSCFSHAWKAISKQYGPMGSMDQVILHAKWQNLKFNDKVSPEEHFLKFDEIKNELITSSSKISEESVKQLILSIGSCFEAVVESFGAVNNEELTVEYIKKRLLAAQARKSEVYPKSDRTSSSNEGKVEVKIAGQLSW